MILTFSAWAQGLKGHVFWYAGDWGHQEMVFPSRWACSPQTSGREAELLCSASIVGQTGSVQQTHVGPQHWITIWSWVPSTYYLLSWCSPLCNGGRWKACMVKMTNRGWQLQKEIMRQYCVIKVQRHENQPRDLHFLCSLLRIEFPSSSVSLMFWWTFWTRYWYFSLL